MRILFYRWKSICEPDILETLEEMGHEVTSHMCLIKNVDYDQEYVNILSEELLKKPYDAVFTVDYFPIISRVCEIIKVPYLSWAVDCPVIQYDSKTIYNECNRIFLFDAHMYEMYHEKNPEHVYYLPLAAATTHLQEAVKQKFHRLHEISFIGSLYEEKCKYNQLKHLPPYLEGYLNGLIESQMLVYGYSFVKQALTDEFMKEFLSYLQISDAPEDYEVDFKEFVAQEYIHMKIAEQERIRLLNRLGTQHKVDVYTMSKNELLPEVHIMGTAESRIEMPQIFAHSKINLNITAKTIQSGLSQRVFDVMGSGGFLLTNYQAELPEFFKIGEEVEAYTSFEELEEKVTFYLKHDEIREKIAKKGFERVTKEHSLRQRLELMFQLAKQ